MFPVLKNLSLAVGDKIVNPEEHSTQKCVTGTGGQVQRRKGASESQERPPGISIEKVGRRQGLRKTKSNNNKKNLKQQKQINKKQKEKTYHKNSSKKVK